MHHFFVDKKQITEENILITGSDVNHMKNVLRMQIGEEVKCSDGASNSYLCKVASLGEEQILLEILEKEEESRELPSKIYLFQGLPKSDKMEWIIQKAVELGVHEVIPVEMKRCVVKLDAKKKAGKEKRWQAISESGAKQSGRSIIPNVHSCLSLKQAMEYAFSVAKWVLVPYELSEDMKSTKEIVGSIQPGEDVAFFIGPEGGFAPEEIEELKAAGAVTITLGKRILRTETAGLMLLSVLMYQFEE